MKPLNQLLSDWKVARQRMEQLNNDIPRIMGNESVKVVKDNFKLQGYDTGTGLKSWPERSAKTNKAYDHRHGVKGSVYQSSNPLLQQTRNLYNLIKYLIKNKSTVFIGADTNLAPYAERMNEGGGGIPARQYIPKPGAAPNAKILKRIKKKVSSEIDKSLVEFKKK